MNEQNAIDNSPITFSIGKDECISTDSATVKTSVIPPYVKYIMSLKLINS